MILMEHLRNFRMTAMEPNSSESFINTQRHNSISDSHLHSSRKEPRKALIHLRRAGRRTSQGRGSRLGKEVPASTY